VTIALPLDALGPITVTEAPPALVSRVNAGHVGLDGDEIVRVLRAMRADPRFRDHVISRGKSFRAAPPEAIVAFLRSAPAIEADPEDVDGDLLRAAGYAAPLAPSTSQPPNNGSAEPTVEGVLAELGHVRPPARRVGR